MHRCAGAVLVADGAVLLCHRAPHRAWFPNVWDIPGGHIEPGETSAETIVRELHEELGIAVVVTDDPFVHIESAALSLSMEIWRIATWGGHTGQPCNVARVSISDNPGIA